LKNDQLKIRIKAIIDAIKSRQQIKKDLKELEKTPFLLKLIGTLNKTATKRQIKSDLKSIESGVTPLNVKTKVNSKQIKSDIAKAVSNKSHLASVKTTISVDEVGSRRNINGFFKSLAAHFGLMTVFFGASRVAKQSIMDTLEIDKAMTGLLKVSTELTGRNAIPEYFRRSNEQAKALNISTVELIKSITEFTKLGFSLDISEGLAAVASQMKLVSDMTIEDSTQTLVSAISAFREIGDLKEHDYERRALAVADAINEIGNRFSISNQGISEGLRRSAAALALAGNDIHQSIALLATGNKILQHPESLGTALKVISMRIRGATSDLQDMGEEVDDIIGGTAKLQDKILSLTNNQVDIMLDPNTFKSTYDILLEIGQVWEQLTDITQAELAETLAGKMRGNALMAILSNIEELPQAYEVALNSAGSATKEFEKWQQGAEAALIRFKETWTGIWFDLISGEDIKRLADLGTGILKLGERLNLLKSILSGLAVYGGVKLFLGMASGITNLITKVNNLGTAIRLVNSTNITKGTINQLSVLTKNLSEAQLKLILSSKNLTEAQRIQILMTRELSKEQAQVTLTTMGLSVANKSATSSTLSFKSAMSGLWLVMKANPLFLIASAVSVAISAISLYKKRQEELNRTLEEARQTALSVANATQEQIKAIDTVKARINDESLSRNALIDIMISHNSAYKNELNNLEDIVDLRAKSNDLLDDELKSRAKLAVQELGGQYIRSKETLESTYTVGYIDYTNIDTAIKHFEDTVDFYNDLISSGAELDEINKRVFENYIGYLKDARKELSEASAIVEKYETAQSILNGTYEAGVIEIEKYTDALEEKTRKELTQLDHLNDALERFKNAQSETEKEFIRSQINSIFKEWRKSLEEIKDVNLREEGIKAYESAVKKASEATQDLRDEINNLKQSYDVLGQALLEQDELGFVDIGTFKKLIDLNYEYLSALDLVNGQLHINEEKALDLAEALRQEALQKLQSAAVSDILAIANGNLEEASIFAKQALEKMGSELIKAGEAGNAGSLGIDNFATSTARLLALQGVDISGRMGREMRAVLTAYNDVAKMLSTMEIGYNNLGKANERARKEVDKLTNSLNEQKRALDEQRKALEEQKRALEGQLGIYDSALRAIIAL